MTDQTPTPAGAEDVRAVPASELETMRRRKDDAYLERNQVVAALAKVFPSGVARTAIPGWSDDWHGCIYIDLPTGQVSWHFHDSHAHLFEGLPPYAGGWDGHDTPEKYRRLAALAARPATANREEIQGEVGEEFGARPAAAGMGVRKHHCTNYIPDAMAGGSDCASCGWPQEVHEPWASALTTPALPANAGEPVAVDGWVPNTLYDPEHRHSWAPEGHLLYSLFHDARLKGGWYRERYERLLAWAQGCAATVARLTVERDEARADALRLHSEKMEHFDARIAAEAALSAERDKSARLEEMHGDALNVIGNLQGLVIRVDGWVRTGCSETAAMAMQGAREDGWSQMGWKQHLSKQRALRAALRAEPEEAAS